MTWQPHSYGAGKRHWWLEGFLTLDADQARLLYEAMHRYYSEEAN